MFPKAGMFPCPNRMLLNIFRKNRKHIFHPGRGLFADRCHKRPCFRVRFRPLRGKRRNAPDKARAPPPARRGYGRCRPVPEAWNPPLRPACGRRKIGTFRSKGVPVILPFSERSVHAQGLRHGAGRRQARFPVRGGGRNPHLLGIRQRAIIHIVKQTGNGISSIVVPCQKPERSQQNKGCYRRDASSHARPPFP